MQVEVLRARRAKAFTLIELLVVLVLAALAVAILLTSPASGKLRDQSRRGACLANLHDLGVALTAYAVDNGQLLPMRGHFAYDLKERETWVLPSRIARPDIRILVNIGVLYGQYVGTDGEVYYCPSAPFLRDDVNYGWTSFFIPLPATPAGVTWSAYTYAAAVRASGFPRNDGTGCLTFQKYPGVPDTWCANVGCPNYENVLLDMRAKGENPYYGKVLPLVSDVLIGPSTHAEGCNVLFTDYSARFVADPTRYIAGLSPTSGVDGQPKMMRAWNFLAKKR